MIDSDFEPFANEVRRLAVVMRLRASPLEQQQITKAYFAAMRRYSLGAVTAGADRWIEQGDRFPKAKQWIDALPAPSAIGLLELTQDEADNWLAAERRGWEQSPCGCVVCVAAGVSDLLLRFVPDFEADGRDARALIGKRVVTRGHWAHGEELGAWHRAKEEYSRRRLAAAPFPRPMPTAETRRDRSRKPPPRTRLVSFRERLEEIFKPTYPKPKPVPVTPLTAPPSPPRGREPGEEG